MAYLVRRLLHGVAVLFGVSIVVFGLTFLTGDPASVLVPLNTPKEDVDLYRQRMGLDRPVPVQYVEFLGRAVRGDFGVSLRYRTQVLPLILQRLPATAALMAGAIVFALLVGIPLGILAARFHRGAPDFLARFIALFGQSLAAPWLGIMLILLFSVTLRWLPSSGATRPEGLILPSVVAGCYAAAGLTRLLRSSLLEVLGNEYIRTARAKGLPGRVVMWRHAVRNAALPVVTFFGIQVAFMFGNTVIAETIFAYPGMGRLAVEAISSRDVPVIQLFVMLAATIVVLVNIGLDLAYAWLDPRIRLR